MDCRPILGSLSTPKDKVQEMSELDFLAFLQSKAEEIMNRAVDKTCKDIADKMVAENDTDGLGTSNMDVDVRNRAVPLQTLTLDGG